MIKTVAISIFSIVAFAKTCSKKNSEYLIWENGKKLSYTDFKGTPSRNTTFNAETTIKIRIDYKIKESLKSFNVYCLFCKNESWIVNKTPDLLEHEQGHFDIGEIYARKLRIELHKIQEQKAEVNYHTLDSLYKKINDDLINRQNEYDEKTNHYLNVPEQEIWIKSIREELKSLENKK